MKNKRLQFILLIIAIILFIPFLGSLFSDQVHWTLTDFLTAGALLLSAGLAVNWVFEKVHKPMNRAIYLSLIFLVLFLLWLELSVGVFGSPIAGS